MSSSIPPEAHITRKDGPKHTEYELTECSINAAAAIPLPGKRASYPMATARDKHQFGRKVNGRRSYDSEYNRCEGPPNHDMVSNSLMDVCHFMVNLAFQDLVSSLKPTAAAYMPSWVGYVARVVTAVVNLIALISHDEHVFGL